jgi:hypothetical protein
VHSDNSETLNIEYVIASSGAKLNQYGRRRIKKSHPMLTHAAWPSTMPDQHAPAPGNFGANSARNSIHECTRRNHAQPIGHSHECAAKSGTRSGRMAPSMS